METQQKERTWEFHLKSLKLFRLDQTNVNVAEIVFPLDLGDLPSEGETSG